MFWSKTRRRLISNPFATRRSCAIILLLWIFVLLVIAYKLTNIIDDGQPNYRAPIEVAKLSADSDSLEFSVSQSSDNEIISSAQEKNILQVINHNHELQVQVNQNVIQKEDDNSNTKKDDTKNYVRNARVFILLIEDERNNYLKASQSLQDKAKRNQRRQIRPDFVSDLPNYDWDIRLPDHIKLVIDILESHRISYTLGSTRNGMPSSLLADTKEPFSMKHPQYSVIIMDDFNKYTQLNRWLRDQIDRHCRRNHIGVITYLTPPTSITKPTILSTDSNGGLSSSSTSFTMMTSSTNENSLNTHESRLADEFPLSFKPIYQNFCKSPTKTQPKVSSLSSCLIDYQLNDRSPILRILKRRPDFILAGPLISNLNRSPWISISTNHITYEPLTWATLARARNHNTQSKADVYDTDNIILRTAPNDSRPHNHINNDNESLDVLQRQRRSAENVSAVSQNIFRFGSIGANKLNDGEKDVKHNEIIASEPRLNHNDTESLLLDMNLELDGNLDESVNSNDKYVEINDQPDIDQSNSNELIEKQEIDLETKASLIETEDRQTLSVYDRGLFDGIKRVIFGGANHHWLNRILLLDSLEHLSGGRILTPLDRFIQIDIDDVFVGERGTKLTPDDVNALIVSQAEISQRYLPQFKFNLGYSGDFFERGLEREQAGDRRLVESASNFTWFCHTWSHKKAHLFNETKSIEIELRKNLNFARLHRLPLIGDEPSKLANNDIMAKSKGVQDLEVGHAEQDKLDSQRDTDLRAPSYAVAPHHSGVYPIHEQLYEAWKRVLNVQVTSTEEYPHLRPAWARRAFVHKAIKVLPRQTCGLYTHTILKAKYPGGFRRLLANIEGGELFQSVLHNGVNIYMTHQSNYGHDRLAPLTFERLFRFVQLHTNLQLRFASSSPNPGALQLADYYFALHPQEQREPLWTNPCTDSRHLAIWAPQKHPLCRCAPSLLIVGPQKSGTTALLEFLAMSASVRSSQKSSTDFEEIQFFNGKHYWRGVDWYFNRFVQKQSELNETANQQSERHCSPTDGSINVDKSATYFDDPKAAERAHALLPNAKIIIMLINPADRAYSWYQHQRAHSDPTSLRYTFEQIILSSSKVGEDIAHHNNSHHNSCNETGQADLVMQLRARCLMPGFYSSHLSRWLNFYASRQIIIIDGQWFRSNPAAVLTRLQTLLRLESPVDYRKQLVYDARKGFFCKRAIGKTRSKNYRSHQCLGVGKGRRYEPMSADARLYLNRIYYGHNRQLARILNDIGQPLPTWLQEATASASVSYNYLTK